MHRRDLFKATAASVASFAAPRIGRAERPNKLVFGVHLDLSVLDPVVTGQRQTRNHAYLVFGTLYGIDRPPAVVMPDYTPAASTFFNNIAPLRPFCARL
jgi:hypothetical protein